MTPPARFQPVPWLRGGHLQTIVPALLPGPRLPPPETLDVTVAPDAAVRVLINRPVERARGTVLVVHGMAGSASSPYARWCADEALRRGWAAARMNLRGCGGTEGMTRRLSDASQGEDVACALRALDAAGLPRPFVAVGYSLGGNLVLLEAGRGGDGSAADAVVAINPPIDLAACVAAIELPANRLYQWNFVARLCWLRAQASRAWGAGPRPRPWTVRTVRRFDELFTAPAGGWPGAAAYYAEASSRDRIASIRRPTWILTAADDPFVPAAMFRRVDAPSCVRVEITDAGGHCGFRQAGLPAHWPAGAALDFATTAIGDLSSTSLFPRRPRATPG